MSKQQGARWYLAWTCGVLALIADQGCRISDVYTNSTYWLYGAGLPMGAARLVPHFPFLIAVVVGAFLAAGRGNVLKSLGFREPMGRGVWIGFAIALPSFLLGPPITLDYDVWACLEALVVWPLTREAFFGALLVSIPVRRAGRSFWPTATCASIAYASSYMPWTALEFAWMAAPLIALTFSITLWHAWLLRRYGWNLWVLISLNATTNASQVLSMPDHGIDTWWYLSGLLQIAMGTVVALLVRPSAPKQEFE